MRSPDVRPVFPIEESRPKMPYRPDRLVFMNKPDSRPPTPALSGDCWQDWMAAVRAFRDARDWSQFHTPKNLAAAIAIEAAELQECFLWKTDGEIDAEMKTSEKREAVVEEVADILLFALLMADRLGIDLGQAIATKLATNERKYPVALARGNARKYTELVDPEARP